jgi:small subunit ribosomal protein S1
MVVDGKVSRVVYFGAFVEVEPGLDGLVHISELADLRVKAASDVVKPGHDVRVRVIEIDAPGRRMSLSLKRANEVAAAAAPATTPSATAKKKKRPELRGGLDY